MSKIVCFGEVLFDVFPNGKKIGGAPLNVANRLASFNNEVAIISAIGKDTIGEEILNFLKASNIDSSCIQTNDFPTGTVQVSLDQKGSASYEIVSPVAWDNISTEESQIRLIKDADALIFGSLVCRHETSKSTLINLLDNSNFCVFDVNLRAPYYSIELLNNLMLKAHFIKFNDDEIFEIAFALGSKYKGLEQNVEFIAELTKTKRICVTKGQHGAVLYIHGQWVYNSGYLTKVKDTVGAGDSFLATLIHHLLTNKSPQHAIDYACAVGAMVAGEKGANPVLTTTEIDQFIQGS